MRKLWLAALMLLASCAVGVPAFAQTPTMKPRFVIMDDYIRARLAKDWDAHAKDNPRLERSYCLGWQYDFWAQEVAYRVTQISEADSVQATPNSIRSFCPDGTFAAELHVHPDQTYFDESHFWDGGPYAYQCLPSEADRRYVKYRKQPFNIVQCTREGTVFYFATDDDR